MAAIEDFLNRDREQAPLQRVGIGGFTTLSRVTDSYTLASQVPVTYLEDGSFASDHIILEPLTLGIEGVIADVYIDEPQPTIIQRTRQEIGNISRYLPPQTVSQAQRASELINDVNDKIKEAQQAVDDGKQLIDFLGNKNGSGSKTNREMFVDAMEALHYGKQLIDIDMPFRRYTTMRITSVSITRDNENTAIRFQIQAQKVRIAQTVFVNLQGLYKKPAPGTNGKTSSEINKGVQEGKSTDRSFLEFLTGGS